MNLGTIIVGAISLVLCALPFILMIRGRKRKEKQLMQSLVGIANNHNCKISSHELFVDFAIGLDEMANQLFFFRKTTENEMAQHINLAEVKFCKVINTSHTISNNDESNKIIDKLELQFSFLDKKIPDNLFVFYNADENTQLNGEILTIEKWAKIVNDNLNPQQKK
ncbi:MAG: hypothetical protein Q7T92_14665 [Lutibacter sp.]|nr:hypothetical protein [Lutibacter sp.]